MKNFFKVGNNKIGYIGDDFQENFGDMEVVIPKKLNLKTKILKRNMTDKEILSEFKPKESNLGELAYAIENDLLDTKNYNANIFYIRDKNNILWAVRAAWNSGSGCWRVFAYSVEYPYEWDAGYQILSSDFDFKTSETMTLGEFDTVNIIEIEWKGNRYRLIENI